MKNKIISWGYYIYIPAVCDLFVRDRLGHGPIVFLFQAVFFLFTCYEPLSVELIPVRTFSNLNCAVEIHANYREAPQFIFDLSFNNFSQYAIAFVIRHDVFSTAYDCFSFRLNRRNHWTILAACNNSIWGFVASATRLIIKLVMGLDSVLFLYDKIYISVSLIL